MTVYSSICTFSSTTPLQSATNGWDAVYAVTFDTINQDIVQRQPWLVDFVGSGPGKFDQVNSGGDTLETALLSGLAVASGGSGNLVRFALTISSGDFTIAGTTPVALSNVVVTIQAGLKFDANLTTPGLHDLTVDTASGLTVTAITGSAGTPPAPLLPFQIAVLQGLVGGFINAHPTLFTGVYANVFTKDYAESVNIPWLLPTAFNYAVADLPAPLTGGILAVLASVSGNVSGLTAEVDPLMFPTNPGMNAAVALSAEIIADDTFIAQFNSEIGTTLSPFAFNAASGMLMNAQAISAYYRIDASSGQVSIIPPSALANSSGETFPFTIAVGGLTFAFADHSITANINNGVVDLGNGYTQTIQLSTSYQLVIDPDTQNIDLALAGSPIITSSIIAPQTTSMGQIAIDVGINAASIVLGEGISFLLDKVSGAISNTAMSGATVNALTRNFFAAERQIADDPTVAVNFRIGGLRSVSMAREAALFRQDAVALGDRFVNAVTLNPDYIFNVDDPDADTLTVPFATRMLGLLGNGRLSGLMSSVKATLVKAGFTDAGNWQNRPSQVTINQARLTGRELSALYKGCVTFINDATNAGKLTYSIYGSLVAEFPASTMDPLLAAQSAEKSAFAGAGGNGSICIRTSAGADGVDTVVTGGMFQDLQSAAARGGYGLAAPIFRDVILNTERPLVVKIAGCILYLGGLVGGYFLGQKLSGLESGATAAADDAAAIASGGPNGPSTLLFSNVTFPFMTRFSSGGGSVPVPANVLKCAAVNGGLILGVEIYLNQN